MDRQTVSGRVVEIYVFFFILVPRRDPWNEAGTHFQSKSLTAHEVTNDRKCEIMDVSVVVFLLSILKE